MVFLVGGFAASSWLYSQLEKYLGTVGVQIFRPDDHTYAHAGVDL